jgi:hypothetical protein
MSRKLKMVALTGLVAASSTACAIPVGNPLGIPLVTGCTIFVGEPASGTIFIDVVPGVVGLGCNLGLF